MTSSPGPTADVSVRVAWADDAPAMRAHLIVAGPPTPIA